RSACLLSGDQFSEVISIKTTVCLPRAVQAMALKQLVLPAGSACVVSPPVWSASRASGPLRVGRYPPLSTMPAHCRHDGATGGEGGIAERRPHRSLCDPLPVAARSVDDAARKVCGRRRDKAASQPAASAPCCAAVVARQTSALPCRCARHEPTLPPL